jgi:4-aminobutyrate aminotransferase-like enzyme
MASTLTAHGLARMVADRLITAPFATPMIVAGSGATVHDADGVEYLDFASGPGVLPLGHCDPEILAAITEQAGRLTQAPGKFLPDRVLEYADALAEVTPGGLDRFFFVNSGAEAADGAIKLALKAALRDGKRGTGILVLDHGFHGRTALPLSLTTMPDRKRGFGPYASFPGVVPVVSPYHYRFAGSPEECVAHCIEAIENAIEVRAPGEIAILIAEPILATGGILVPPPDYWPRVFELCRREGILIILDEVFTGFGRTGRLFAAEHWDLVPDIMTMGKALGGGLPLGAFAASEHVASAMEPGDHYTTFGANNVLSFAAGIATLRALRQRGVVAHAAETGAYLREGLRELQSRHPLIGEVRGEGMLNGVEIVADPATKTADEALTNVVVAELKRQRVLVLTSGYRHATIRLTPPLIVSREQVDSFVERFDAALTAAADWHPGATDN